MSCDRARGPRTSGHPLIATRRAGYLDDMGYRVYEREYVPSHGSGIGGAIYLVIGVLIAVAQNYFDHLSTLGRLLSAVLAVMLWPLLLLGIDIRVG